MTYDKTKWLAAYKKAVEDTKTTKPTSGLPCAVATLRYVRDGIIADVDPKDKDTIDSVKDSVNELILAITTAKGVDEGFASNASAAARACGFKMIDEVIKVLES